MPLPRKLCPCCAAIVALLVAGLAPIRAADPPKSDLGTKVVGWARSQLGKQVGSGQCADLAGQALKAAGAKSTDDYGVKGIGKDYVWGKPVNNLKDVKPGDVIQFRGVKLSEPITIDGKMKIRNSYMAHHTVIVSANLGNGKLKVLDQNRAGKKIVQESDMDLSAKKEGTLWMYRPEKK